MSCGHIAGGLDEPSREWIMLQASVPTALTVSGTLPVVFAFAALAASATLRAP